MSGSVRSGAIENQIVNALSLGSVVYARRIAGTTSAAEPESQALSTAQRWPSGLSSSWRLRCSSMVVGIASSTSSARSSGGGGAERRQRVVAPRPGSRRARRR